MSDGPGILRAHDEQLTPAKCTVEPENRQHKRSPPEIVVGMAQSDRKRPDHFAKRAKAEGYAARSVYKLAEIDRRYRVLDRVRRVVDLGSHPGSWSALVRERNPQAALVGVDLQETPRYPGTQLVGSVATLDPAELERLLGGRADLVLSDMAPNTTGARLKDHVDQLELVREAWRIAQSVLTPGGTFVAKVFDGEDAPALLDELRRSFETFKRVRPEATRKDSRELFAVGLGYRA
jgi:23S rRNA (uridine2552-2'-O)-methyltransferase